MATWGNGTGVVNGEGLAGSSSNPSAAPKPGSFNFLLNNGDIGAVAFGLTEDQNSSLPPGDFTNAPGNNADGGILLYPDQDYQQMGSDLASQTSNSYPVWMPYFSTYYGSKGNISSILSYFSPNRQVASAILMGTIPAPDTSGNPKPWQSLLFCPNPVQSSSWGVTHPGFGGPNHFPPYTTVPDHALLDFFWMPVVEPYPISEAFSTAGKINLNYQIVPFTYVNRETGLYAVMKSTKITAIPSNITGGANGTGYGNIMADYKNNAQLRSYSNTVHTRLNIDIGQTLQAFDSVFAKNDLFRTASQICEMFLVPQGQTLANVSDPTGGFWTTQLLTGANSREAPYNQIYPRVTTKSNTFQVHFRVQILTQTRADMAAGVFDSTKGDSIGGEYRGSSIIERYIDPNDTTLPDFATTFAASPTPANTMDSYYKFRILNTTAFNP